MIVSKGETDFDDIINDAANLVQKGAYKSFYKYILIDEFNGITTNRFTFTKSLIDQDWKTKTFCITNEWQSINMFTVNDFPLIQEPGKYFNPCETLIPKQTFRFNEV